MHTQKLFYWLLTSVLILAAVAGCKAPEPTPEPTALELVPQGANLIAEIQVSRIVDDQDLIDAYAKADKEPGQPQTVEEALDELVEESGIDLRDFSRAVIFADITAMEQADYLGCILEGTFDEKQFIDNMEEEAGEELTTSDYKGYRLYIDKEDEFGIAFLSDKMLLLGTTKAVKDAIDVSKGERQQVSGILLDTYNRLGDALIKFACEFPEEAWKTIEENVPSDIPISLEVFANIDIIGFALSKEAETITVRITPHFLSTDSAQDARDTLSGAIMLSRATLEVPEIKELLRKTKVTLNDSWVTIALEITLSELEQLTETFRQ